MLREHVYFGRCRINKASNDWQHDPRTFEDDRSAQDQDLGPRPGVGNLFSLGGHFKFYDVSAGHSEYVKLELSILAISISCFIFAYQQTRDKTHSSTLKPLGSQLNNM